MTLPRRLVEQPGTDPFKQLLLRSAKTDLPSPRMRANARLALGLGAGASVMAASTTVAAAASAGAASVAKLLAIGFVVGLATVGGVSLGVNATTQSQSRAPAVPAPPAMTVAANDRSPQTGRAASQASDDDPSRKADTHAEIASERPIAPKIRSASVASGQAALETRVQPPRAEPVPRTQQAEPAELLPAELAALDEARRAVAGGNPRAALDRLDRMKREFPASSLAQEASVVRIEALAKSGARETATIEATRFIEAHPGSPYATRLQRLLHPDPAK